jgi:hypothetical protein
VNMVPWSDIFSSPVYEVELNSLAQIPLLIYPMDFRMNLQFILSDIANLLFPFNLEHHNQQSSSVRIIRHQRPILHCCSKSWLREQP